MPRIALSDRPRRMRVLAGVLSLGLISAGAVVGATPASAALPGNAPANCVASGSSGVCTFSYGFTGGEQRFTVPTGITSLDVVAVGASGGNYSNFRSGGAGAAVASTVEVNPGDVLYVEVGGNGQAGDFRGGGAPGYNGGGSTSTGSGSSNRGGGGGGGSDLRTITAASTGSLESRLVVAAGGGGAGGCGNGGSAGQGGGLTASCGNTPGGPGTATSGGSSGGGGVGTVTGGSLGQGGTGAFLGGGGGGGLYGGGGGGSNTGGGGGSSLGTVTGLAGPASVTIRYTSPLTALEFDGQPVTAVAGSTVPYTITGRNAQGDSWNATSIATLSSTDASDLAAIGSVRFSKVGSRQITAARDAISVSQSADVVPGPQASLVITPSAAGVTAGDSVAFTTAAYDGEGNALGDRTSVTGFTSGGTDGSADAVTGATVAFTRAGARTVTATDGGFTATAGITVQPAALASISLSTASRTIRAGVPTAFTVTGADRFGNNRGDLTGDAEITTPDARDSVAGASVTFSTAGPRVVTADADGFTTDLEITVVAGDLASIEVNPVPGTVVAGDQVPFAVTGEDVYGNDLGDVTASAVLTSDRASDQVSGSTVTVTESGARTVTAAVGSVTDDVTVDVQPGALASITIAPQQTTAVAGEDVAFTVTGADEFGNDLGDVTDDATFSTDDPRDEIDGAGVAFSAAGSRTVTATVGDLTDEAVVTVGHAPLASLIVTPDSAVVTAGDELGFTVTGADRFGNEIGDLTADSELASDDPTDEVDQAVITVTRAGVRTVTATIGAIVGSVTVNVGAGPVASISLGLTSSAVASGNTVGFSVLGTDAYGNALGDVSAGAVLSSDDPSDVVDEARVTFGRVGGRTVTATVDGVSDTLAVVVIAAPAVPITPPATPAAAAPAPAVLAATGGAVSSGVALALICLLTGVALTAVSRRRHAEV